MKFVITSVNDLLMSYEEGKFCINICGQHVEQDEMVVIGKRKL